MAAGMIAAVAWLPPSAISTERLQPLLTKVVTEWCQHWFAKSRASISPVLQDNCPDLRRTMGSLPQGLSVAVPDDSRSALAGAMLGSSVPQGGVQQCDHAVLAHLTDTCINDLVERLQGLTSGDRRKSAAADLNADIGERSRWEIYLPSGKRVLTLALSAPFSVSLVKSSLKSARHPSVYPLHDAIRKEQVQVAAKVGQCAISCADLRGLAVGDVLVLDRSADVPIPLVINGSLSPLHAALEMVDANARLRIVAEEQVHA